MSADTELYEITDEKELDDLVAATLREAGTELDELRRQADEGRFESEKFRRTWFVIEGLGRG